MKGKDKGGEKRGERGKEGEVLVLYPLKIHFQTKGLVLDFVSNAGKI